MITKSIFGHLVYSFSTCFLVIFHSKVHNLFIKEWMFNSKLKKNVLMVSNYQVFHGWSQMSQFPSKIWRFCKIFLEEYLRLIHHKEWVLRNLKLIHGLKNFVPILVNFNLQQQSAKRWFSKVDSMNTNHHRKLQSSLTHLHRILLIPQKLKKGTSK